MCACRQGQLSLQTSRRVFDFEDEILRKDTDRHKESYGTKPGANTEPTLLALAGLHTFTFPFLSIAPTCQLNIASLYLTLVVVGIREIRSSTSNTT